MIHIYRVDHIIVLITNEVWTPIDKLHTEIEEFSIWIHPDWTEDEAKCLVARSLQNV